MPDNLKRAETGVLHLAAILAPAGSIPVSRSTWWEGVRTGRDPKPVKLGPRVTVWRVEGDQPEGVRGREFHFMLLLTLVRRGGDPVGQQRLRLVALLASLGRRVRRVGPDGEQLPLAVDPALETPEARPCRVHQQEQSTAVRRLERLLGGLGVPDARVGQQWGHRLQGVSRDAPNRTPKSAGFNGTRPDATGRKTAKNLAFQLGFGRLRIDLDDEVVPGGGIEPPTLRFSVACSTN